MCYFYVSLSSTKNSRNLDVNFQTFRKFGCRVECQNDLPGDALQSEMKKFSQSIKPGIDKFIIVCILSHGWLNPDTRFDEIVGVDGNCVSTDELTNIVIDGEQCPGGRGIPKLFLIQACRGMYYLFTYVLPKYLEGRGQKFPKMCLHKVLKMLTRGGGGRKSLKMCLRNM